MTIINQYKLNECGYQTNEKKNVILPITDKGYTFYRLQEGFLVAFNQYEVGDRDFIINQKLDAEIKRLSRSGALIY